MILRINRTIIVKTKRQQNLFMLNLLIFNQAMLTIMMVIKKKVVKHI